MKKELIVKLAVMLLSVFCSALALAQTPKDQAWKVLTEAAASSKDEIRAGNARALGLINKNAKAVELLEKALEDKDDDVRSSAATSLGLLKAKSSIPKLVETAKKETDGNVVLAVAKALTDMDDPMGFAIYYAIVTGERKSGQGLVASQSKMLNDMLKNPKSMANMAFQQGMGFVPFGGLAMGAFQAVRSSGKNEVLVKAAAVRTLSKDPDPKSTKALVAATGDKEWVVRAAAYDALSRRGDASVVPDMLNGLSDKEEVVKLTAAAAIANLSEGKK